MIPPRLDWLLPEPLADPPSLTGFGRPIATLLVRRGLTTDAAVAAFLDGGPGAFHDVLTMADAPVALDRLDRALTAGERIAIWGDYDADGMTAVAIWVLALRAAGHDPLRLVPSRLAEGYGLSVAGLRRLAAQGARVVVTCDCGVSNAAEVEAATDLGLDVIVTDHHLPPDRLPPALAVVDPHRPDCPYPDPDLTGAGISYKLAEALLARRGHAVPDLVGIAAIGTVADLAPMTGESRAIVREGLAALAVTSRAGLRALLAGATDDRAAPTARDLAFGVAPRLNAAGRLADAELAIALLVEEDADRATTLQAELEAIHRQRRELTAAAVEMGQRLAAGAAGEGPVALRHDEWLPGLVGLVAGRLTDQLARPVAAATLIGSEVRGSVRAPRDFHAAEALAACADLLTKRGGHAAAGGFSLPEAAWPAFVERFAALPRPYPTPSSEVERPGRVAVDLVLPAAFVDWGFAEELARLAPFGPGHTDPLLAVTGLRVGEARRVGPDGAHLGFRLRRGAETVDAVQFGAPADQPLPAPGEAIDLLATLERDTFDGRPRLRLRVVDWASADASPLLARRRAAMTPVAMAVDEPAVVA